MRKKELIRNIKPEDFGSSITYKSAKKGNTSFRVTKKLLDSVYKKSKTSNNLPVIHLTIPANEDENFVLTCQIKKIKK